MAVKRRRIRRSPEEVWRGIIEEWRTSGLSVDEFCEKERYSSDAFRLFYKKLFGELPPNSASGNTKTLSEKSNLPAFAPVQIVEAHATELARSTPNGDVIDVILPTGFVLRLKTDCPMQFLRSVVLTLEGC